MRILYNRKHEDSIIGHSGSSEQTEKKPQIEMLITAEELYPDWMISANSKISTKGRATASYRKLSKRKNLAVELLISTHRKRDEKR
jgi:hypothetical protein